MSHLDRYVFKQCLMVFAFFTLVFALVIVKLVESVVTEPARTNLELWYLVYAPSVIGVVLFWVLMYLSINPKTLRKQGKLSGQNT
tara:strand:+ start:132 stop:386 length:255 start_codon:yes stop_codon:yes gene_type:complete